jgi:hypothetical protein
VALRAAQAAVVSGVAGLAPAEFTQPPPGASPTTVGVATPVVNLTAFEVIERATIKGGDAGAQALVLAVKQRLSGSPTSMAVPVAGPNGQVGVLQLRKENGAWTAVSFEIASPLSSALKLSNVRNVWSNMTRLQSVPGTKLLGARTAGESVKASRHLRGVVNVKGLNVSFLAYEDGGALKFEPLWDSSQFDFKAGQLIDAAKALQILGLKGTITKSPR